MARSAVALRPVGLRPGIEEIASTRQGIVQAPAPANAVSPIGSWVMRRIGYLAVALAAMLWAFGGTYARVLIDRGASAREITEARAWIAALGIGIILAARKGRRLPTGDRVPRALFVLFGLSIAAANFFYYSAIAALPVAVAIVIQYTAPGLVVLWLAFVRRQRP